MNCLILLVVVAGAAASHPAGRAYYYGGKFAGKCGNDGLYYNDRDSFVICSNGNGYVQPCAPGSRNGNVQGYRQGHSYHYNPFCGVNLVDTGYTARHAGYSRVHRSHGYAPAPAPHGHRQTHSYTQGTRGYGGGYQHNTRTTYRAPSNSYHSHQPAYTRTRSVSYHSAHPRQ